MNINSLDINRLKECRERLGISKNEAARRIGISQPAYLRYEVGSRTPSKQVIKEIANVFNTSIEYLTGTSDDNTSDYIIITKDKDQALFEFLDKYTKMNSLQKQRLLDYIDKFN